MRQGKIRQIAIACMAILFAASVSQAATRTPTNKPRTVNAHGRTVSSMRHSRLPLKGMAIHTGSFGSGHASARASRGAALPRDMRQKR